MALRVASQVGRSDILDTPFVNVAGRDVASGNQVAQPLCGVWIDYSTALFENGAGELEEAVEFDDAIRMCCCDMRDLLIRQRCLRCCRAGVERFAYKISLAILKPIICIAVGPLIA